MVQRQEFRFDSRDMKNRNYAVKFVPERRKKACLIVAHGMGEHFGRYYEMAEFLAEQGIVVAGADMLGHGRTVADEKDFGYFCEQDPATVVVRDVHRLKKMIQQENPDLPIFVMGHSMGSFVIRNYIEMYGSGINGAILMGTGTFPASSIIIGRRFVKLLRRIHGGRFISKPLAYHSTGKYRKKSPDGKESPYEWGCSRPEIRALNDADPLQGHSFTLNGYETLFDLVERSQDKERMAKIPKDLPLFIISGDGDPVGDFGKGVIAAADSYRKIGMTNVTMKIYQNDRHELYLEKDRFDIMMDIMNFFRKCYITEKM